MTAFIVFFNFIFGAIMGSFLNVVAIRFRTGKSIGGRSLCFSCTKQLSWYELIPVFSWLVQRGRCRGCHSKISKQEIIGEVLSGLLFTLVGSRFLFSGEDFMTLSYGIATLYLFVITSVLVVILFYDMRHKIIPDELSFSFGALAFLGMFFFSFNTESIFVFQGFHIPSLLHIFSGILIPLPFVILWIISKGEWIGLGDPKLMVGMGFLFGISFGYSAVILAFWIGSLWVVALLLTQKILNYTLLQKRKKSIMKTELPFAPFLVFATIITLACGFNLFI